MSKLVRKDSLSEPVKERKLRPIYELLDSGNNKKVTQEADRLLKKHPGFLCVKVLKGLALLRMGKKDECWSLINPVFTEVPTDENTIQALSICYRELDKPEMVCELMENACKKDKSEDLLTFCYMSHVRVCDFKKQHLTAMALYKLYPKVPYFSWAIMSLYVKSMVDPPETAERITLPLAEKMFAKFIIENQIKTEHELTLYLLILMKQKKFETAFNVMDTFSKEGVAWKTGMCPTLMIQCLKETNQTDKLIDFLETLITKRLDEWQYLHEYVSNFWETHTERVIRFMETVKVFTKMYNPASRAPVMSRMMLYKFLRSKSDDSAVYETEFFEAFHEHVQLFGDKPFFFFDISLFLTFVKSKKDQDELVEVAEKLVSIATTVPERMQRTMTTTFLKYYFGRVNILSEPSKALKSTEIYVSSYLAVREHLAATNRLSDPREGLPHDDFLTLSSLILIESFWVPSKFWKGHYLTNDMKHCSLKTDDKVTSGTAAISSSTLATTNPIEENSGETVTNGLSHSVSDAKFNLPEEDFPVILSMALLEYGLDKSHSCSQMRVLLGKVYNLCGAVVAGTDQFMRLDIKHAQIESLGYLYIWKTVSSGVLTDTFRVLVHADAFYTSYHKESVEHILSAYKYGSWEKIIEFMEFRHSILRSTQGCLIKVESRLLEYTKEALTSEAILEIARRDEYDAIADIFDVADQLTENRDFRVVNTYQPGTVSEELKKLTFKDDLLRLKVRGSILSLINNFVLAIDEIKDDAKFNNRITYIEKLLPLFEALVADGYEEFNIVQPYIDGPWAPRMYQYKSSGMLEILLSFFSVLLKAAKQPNAEDIPDTIQQLISQIEIGMNKRVQVCKGGMKFILLNFAKIGESLFTVIEALGFCATLCSVLKGLLQRSTDSVSTNGGSGKIRKKKAKDVAEDIKEAVWVESFNTLIKQLQSHLTSLEVEISNCTFSSGGWFPTTWKDLEEMWKGKVSDEILQTILPSVLPNIMDKLNTSFYRAYSEMDVNLGCKKYFLGTINIKLGAHNE